MHRSALATLALALGVTAPPAGASESLSDGIAAQVGSDIVLVSEVLARVAPVEARLRQANVPAVEIAKLRASGLEQLIERRLISQVVRRSELYATDAEIDQAIEMIARENGITRPQLEQSVQAQGLTVDTYRAEIKDELERRKVVGAMVASKVTVNDSDVRALYIERFSSQPEGGEMVHLRQILVANGGISAQNGSGACAAVRDASARIATGESFEKVASTTSQVAPAQGGDIGWLHSDQLADWMADVVGPLQDGQVSDLVELPFGCSLLKLVERRIYEPVSFEEAEEKLRMEIYEQNLDTEFRKWMETLRKQTFIERKGHFADAAMLGSKSGYATGNDAGGEEGSPF